MGSLTSLRRDAAGQGIVELPMDRLLPYHNHHFQLYSGERYEDMVESIATHGILQPLFVRPLEDRPGYFEILAGHNRQNCGKAAGLIRAPCIVKENLSDEEAEMYVVETNMIQRSFGELLPTEQAAVLRVRYDKMFSQGKRNDILREIQAMHGGQEATVAGSRQRSDEQLGREYGMSRSKVARLLRINELIHPLKDQVNAGTLKLDPAISLSFLSSDVQAQVVEVLEGLPGAKLTKGKAEQIRAHAAQDEVTKQDILDVISGAPPKPSVSLRWSVYGKYFAPETPKKEIADVVDRALTLYFSQEGREEE